VRWNRTALPPRFPYVRSSIPAESAPSPDLREHLPALRSALLQQRRFRIDQLADLRSVEPADAVQEEVTETLRTGASVALSGIEAALDRMARGTYGQCVLCGSAIPVERLEILPAVALCVTCQEAP
jgi:DnaK suppressor protein